MQSHPGLQIPNSPFKAWQLAALCLPFLMPVVESVRKLGLLEAAHPFWLVLAYTLGGLWLLVFGAALIKSFPTWTLPSVGVVLFMIGFLIKMLIRGLLVAAASAPLGFAWPDALQERVLLMLLGDLIFLAPMLLILAFILKAAPPFWQRVQEDRSLFSFLIYGMAIPLVILYDEYQGRGIYELAGSLIMLTGALLFLVIASPRGRVLVLVLGVLTSASILSFGLYQIFPDQYFAPGIASFRVWESIQPLIELPALLILLLLPLIFPRLPILRGPYKLIQNHE